MLTVIRGSSSERGKAVLRTSFYDGGTQSGVIFVHLQAHESETSLFDSFTSHQPSLFTSLGYCGEDELKFRAFQPLLTPVGHRLDRQEVGG